MDDLISRRETIDALDVLCQEHRYRIPGKRETYSQYNEAWQDALDRAEVAIGNLPAVQPERKRGEWIPVTYRYVPVKDGSLNTKIIWIDAIEPDDIEGMKCSECGTVFDFTEARNWCSECGADMRKENES